MSRIEMEPEFRFDPDLITIADDPQVEEDLRADIAAFAVEGWEDSEAWAELGMTKLEEVDTWEEPILPSKTEIECNLRGFYYPTLLARIPVQRTAELKLLNGGDSEAGSGGYAAAG